MEISESLNQSEWEKFNLSFSRSSFLQSWPGGEMHGLLAKKIIRRGYLVDGVLQGIALLIEEKAKRGKHFLCPGGPVLNWEDERLAKEILTDLGKIGKEEGAVFLRVRPQAFDSPRLKRLFKSAGFVQAPMHLEAETTWELKLNQPDASLLKGMRKGTRLVIKRTQKEGVRIEKSLSKAEAKLLYQLQLETVQRHRFVPFSLGYLQAHTQAFLPDNLVFFKAFLKNTLVAIAMVVYYGEAAVYHYAASKASLQGISPPSLVLWEAIKEAKERGCQVFNFWGVASSDNPKHRFAGVTRFKKGFGGQRVFYLRAQDLPLTPRYWPIYGFETLRRLRRGL